MKKAAHRIKTTKKKLRTSLHTHPLLSITVIAFCILVIALVTDVLAAKPQPVTNQFKLEDVASDGSLSNNGGTSLGMTKDARYVLFSSSATNLGSIGANELFVRDRVAGITELVSILPDDTQEAYLSYKAFISSDGNYVTWSDYHTGNIYVRNRATHTTTLLLQGATDFQSGVFPPGSRWVDYMTPDARYFVFVAQSMTYAGHFEQWLYDRQNNAYEELSVSTSGVEGDTNSVGQGMLSDDGRYYIFSSPATTFISNHPQGQYDVYIRDRQAGTTQLIYPNGQIPDRGTTSYPYGTYNPYISGDARYVVFNSDSTNIIPSDPGPGVFLLDRQTNTLEREDITNTGAHASLPGNEAQITDDGNYVVFESQSPDLNPYNIMQSAIYIHSRITNTTELITQNPACKALLHSGNDFEQYTMPILSDDGRYINFSTDTIASTQDTNTLYDTYLRDRLASFGKLAHNCKK